MPPKFLYFDLGNVLLYFSHERMCRQMAEVAGVDERLVWRVLFETPLAAKSERGEVTTSQFYEEFCRAVDRRPDFDRLALAVNDIFTVNVGVKALVAQLLAAGHRLGMLSNTSELHWSYFADGRYSLISDAFEQVILSFRVGAMKPEAKIFEAATKAAGVAGHEVFFVDDIAGHVAGAREFGLDAVQYTTTAQLAADLRARGVEFNY